MRGLSLIGLSLLLALSGGCQRRPPQPVSQQATDSAAGASQGIGWFKGSVEQAFATAKGEGRPVLLFWGAVWCPFCHTLQRLDAR